MKKHLLLLSCSLVLGSAFSQENCGNGIDDDGDGLVDCADTISCTSNSVPTGTLFNTATNGMGGVLPGGSNDANWQISVGTLVGPYSPAVVMTSIPGSYYASPWPDCGWISHNALGTHSVDEDFYYKIEFYLPCFSACGTSYADSAVFCLSMDFFSDNSVDEVYVNGIAQSAELAGVPALNPYYNVGFNAAGGLSFSLCDDWQPGLNALIIKVSSGPGFEGFLAQNSTSAPPPSGDPTILSPFSNYTVCDSTGLVNFAAASAGGTWSATCGTCINSTSGVFDPSLAGPGTYTVTYSLTVPCPTSDTSVIEVLALPPNAAIIPEPPHCINDPAFNLTPVTAGGTWTGTGITNAVNGTFNPSVSGAGTFTITHIFSGTCGDTATQTVTVTALPVPSFTSNINAGCKPVCINFSELPGTTCAGGLMYYFGDGDSAAAVSPSHCYADAGVYSVTIACTDANGCTGNTVISNMITVYDYPVANFNISPATIVNPNTTVNFSNTSTGGLFYAWTFGDPSSGIDNVSGVFSPDHTYATEGNYCIDLYVYNGLCGDSIKYCLIVEGEGTIFIPNVFTPNGDLSNDLFLVSSSHMKEISYTIYDRWGLKMTDYNGLTGGWNGRTKSGKIAPDGTYFYILKAMTERGKEIGAEGYLQLLSEK